jgi:hypothetical protein
MKRTPSSWVALGLGLLVTALPSRAGDLEAGIAALEAGRPAAAEPLLSRAVEAAPRQARALYYRARCRAALGREAEAIDDYRAALAAKPDSVASAQEMATLLERMGRRDEAAAAYARWLRIAPGNADAAAGLARCGPAQAATATAAAPPAPPPPPTLEPVSHRVALNAEGLDDASLAVLLDRNADVTSAHLLDYTFGSAPTDWVPLSGRWEVVNRFACDPTWSFFGGWSQGLACLWNKHRFTGDIVVEAYVAFRHGLPWNPEVWSYRPADLCLTLCGDGSNPDSGYSFQFGGDEGERSVIRRGKTVLGASASHDVVPPSFCDEHPSMDDFHRRWWRLEARVEGSRLTFLVDGETVAQVYDPQPLSSGQLALWTVHNGMMVARVRVAYAGEMRPIAPKVRVAAAPSAAGDGVELWR